jgi:hypothetical protein
MWIYELCTIFFLLVPIISRMPYDDQPCAVNCPLPTPHGWNADKPNRAAFMICAFYNREDEHLLRHNCDADCTAYYLDSRSRRNSGADGCSQTSVPVNVSLQRLARSKLRLSGTLRRNDLQVRQLLAANERRTDKFQRRRTLIPLEMLAPTGGLIFRSLA